LAVCRQSGQRKVVFFGWTLWIDTAAAAAWFLRKRKYDAPRFYSGKWIQTGCNALRYDERQSTWIECPHDWSNNERR